MFLPNVVSSTAKYWNKYIDLMCSFNFKAVNPRSLKSVLVLLAQILGSFGQIWVIHKFGWVFHKFIENGEFYLGWFQSLTGIIETPGKNTKQSETKSTKKYLLFAKVDWEFLGGISEWHPALRDGLPKKVPVLLDFVQITSPCWRKADLMSLFFMSWRPSDREK